MPDTLTLRPNEQAPELARRVFGLPLGADEEAAAVLRYYFENRLGYASGVLPDSVTTLELPPVAELFRLYRTRALGERPTGRWTQQARKGKAGKPKL